MASQDYYDILGVGRTADQDSIKKAYRKLAMQFHPDRNPGNPDAENKFKEAAEAYDILGNPEKRAKYDRFGKQAFSGSGAAHSGFNNAEDIFSSFSDIFGDFFGGAGAGRSRGRNRNGPQRGADLRYMCEVSLKDVLQPMEKEIEFDTEENCSTCNGSGAKKGTTPDNCGTCGGSGQVLATQGFFQVATTCPTCRGEGRVIRDPCGSCHGKGRSSVHRKLRVNIPAGVDNGTQLRVSNEGEGGFRGGPAGDLYVELRVREDRKFQRRGQDLLGRVTISYVQALLGSEIEVDTLDGKERLHVQPGTGAGERVRIDKRGIPALRGGNRGHLYFEVEIDFPKKLKKDEEKLLREIAEIRGESVPKSKKSIF